MAFKSSKSKKCPVCVVCTPDKIEAVNKQLGTLLEDVRASGEIPKARDPRFDTAANILGVAPHSLRYHLKECLLDLEIQDQRYVELKDLSQAIATAKTEYANNPTMQNATAYTSLLTSFRAMASDIEGQQDPEQTVTFIAETVMGPMSKKTIAVVTEELRSLRESISSLLPKSQQTYVDSQLKGALARMSNALRDTMDESIRAVCGYYKVELDAKDRKRALDNASPVQSSADAGRLLATPAVVPTEQPV